MSDDPTPKPRVNPWKFVVGGLAIVVAIMSYGMFEMNAKIEALSATDHQTPRIHVAQSTKGAIDPDISILPDDPFDAGANWNPFQEMEAMQRRIDNMFNDSFGRLNLGGHFDHYFQGFTHAPRLDLTDEGDRYVARLDIPGSNDSEINVSLEGQTLTVEGKTTQTDAQQNASGQVLRDDRIEGKFQRQVTLPEPVDPSKKIETKYEDGVFTATVYKLHPDQADS